MRLAILLLRSTLNSASDTMLGLRPSLLGDRDSSQAKKVHSRPGGIKLRIKPFQFHRNCNWAELCHIEWRRLAFKTFDLEPLILQTTINSFSPGRITSLLTDAKLMH